MIGFVIPLIGFTTTRSHAFAQIFNAQANATVSVSTKEFDGTTCACFSVIWTFHPFLSEKDFETTVHMLMHQIYTWFNVISEVITVNSSLELERRVS